MTFVTNTSGTVRPNFLDSEVGLVLKTYEIDQSKGVADGNRKIVAAGTPYPTDDASAVGIVFENVDVTDGNAPGSLLVAGRVLKDNLTIASATQTALEKLGIVFVTAPTIERL